MLGAASAFSTDDPRMTQVVIDKGDRALYWGRHDGTTTPVSFSAPSGGVLLTSWRAPGISAVEAISGAPEPPEVGSEGAPTGWTSVRYQPDPDHVYTDVTVNMTPDAAGSWFVVVAVRDYGPSGYQQGILSAYRYSATITAGALTVTQQVAQYPESAGSSEFWGTVIGVMVYPNYAPWNAPPHDPSQFSSVNLPPDGTLGTTAVASNRYYMGEEIASGYTPYDPSPDVWDDSTATPQLPNAEQAVVATILSVEDGASGVAVDNYTLAAGSDTVAPLADHLLSFHSWQGPRGITPGGTTYFTGLNPVWDLILLRFGGPTVAPPCRLFPREDGLGVGGGRHYPPSKSQQRSARRFGYY